MQVSNNITSFNVWKNYTSNVSNLRKSMSKLSSGSRINNAGDDPSGLAMSERLRTQTRNTAAASSNVENKLNYLQTADSWMQKIHDMLGRMGELAVMANDGTKSSTDTAVLQNEFAQMQDEIVRITGGAAKDSSGVGGDANAAGKFNGIELFQGGAGISQQVGADGGQIFTSALSLDLSSESTQAIDGTSITWGTMVKSVAADTALDAAVESAKAEYYAASINEAIAAGAGTDLVSTVAGGTASAEAKQGIVDLLADADSTAVAGDALNALVEYDATVTTTAADAKDAYDAAVQAASDYEATVSISSLDGASQAVTDVNAAIDFLSQKRSEVGAEMKRMEHTLDGLRSYEENISATESRIRDVDVAKETSEMSKYNILQQVGTAMMAQANQLPQGVLQLVG
jgi:flagellin